MTPRCRERARQAGGEGSVEALGRQRRVEPSLLRFYADQAVEWLVRALPDRPWSASPRGQRITISGGRRQYQLRLAPDRCRWVLVSGNSRNWSVPTLAGPCLSFVDWLRQIRHAENRAAGLSPSRKS